MRRSSGMSALAALPVESPPAYQGSIPEIGDTILGVTILAEVGAGNVGRVWTALDGEAMVALKIFDPALGGEPGRGAFARGVQAMEKLSSLDDERRASILRLIRTSPDGLQLVTDLVESSAEDI